MSVVLQENMVIADRFRLIRMIGRGGMGSVWQAMHIGLDTPCALKFIEGELANVADAHARFEREAKAAAQLRSPHVVQIIDHGVWQGRPYIAMELLEGEDLGKTLAKAGGKLPPGQVNVIIQQVCRALTKAHAGGIVHRDLKPDNIFLVTDDDRQIVKILDFGVAKNTSQAIDGSNTKTGAMLGTPYYMSPEQAQGIKSVDARSDLWSLAVIVYQAITGRLPFESEALGDLLVKIIVQPVPIPSQVAHVPPGFDRWWAKAAERNPDNRFATAKEFATQLELALGATALMSEANQPGAAEQFRGTAVMQHGQTGQETGQNRPFQNTPNPHLPFPHANQTAAFVTPHPGNPTPPGMVMGQIPTNPNFNNPHPVSNPATFSGVEPPVTLPKKGPPAALIAVIAAAVLIGIVGGGVVVARNRSASASKDAPPPASTSVATAAESASAAPTVAKSEEPPPPLPPIEPTTTAAGAAPTPTTTHVAVAPTKATTGGGGTAKPPPTATTTNTKPPASAVPTTTAAAPSSSVKPKWNGGF
jgi:serine/threonine protein kinase